MDSLTHFFSSVIVGSVFATLQKRERRNGITTITFGVIGGIAPDIDSLSDLPFVKYMNDNPSIYQNPELKTVSLPWFSHHHFFHSLVGGIFISVLFVSLFFFLSRHFLDRDDKKPSIKSTMIYLFSMLCSYFIHLVFDFITPPGIAGGMMLLWPLSKLFGGTGNVWWFHNYDIILILLVSSLVCIFVVFKERQHRFRKMIPILSVTIVLLTIQIHRRDFVYNPTKGAEFSDCERHAIDFQRHTFGHQIIDVFYRRN
jgi:membrane-bound metal-dependent hydrolase YbcI (DUF457 family)